MTTSAIVFARPEWIVLVWGWLGLWLVVGLLERRGSDVLDRLVAPLLQARLVERPSPWRRWTRYALLGLAGLGLAVATMQPQTGERFVSTPRAGAEIMIALDVSRSMLADDARPSRLERAKAELRDLLGYLRDDHVGLIAFAGRASLLSPMTPDTSFLRLALDGAGPHSVPRGGTRIGEAIRRAVVGFGAPGPAQRALILITDGEDHDAFALDAAQAAAEAGIKIIAIGFGDEAGSPIFVRDPQTGARTQLRDADGQPVLSRLNGDLLREIALATDGAFVPAGTGVLDLASIYEAHVAPLTRGEMDDRGRTIRDEAYQLFLLASFLCLLAGVRVTAGGPVSRGAGGPAAVAALLCLAWATAPPTAGAQSSAGVPSDAFGIAAEADAPDGDASAPGASDEAPSAAQPLTPRERFNRGNEALRADRFDEAAAAFREARRDATDDPALRRAAAWNLGVTAAARAERERASDSKAALESLHEAADWLREAVAMAPDEDGPRHDLDVVMRRTLVLADEIAQAEQGSLEEALDALIAAQRERSLTAAGILEAVSVEDALAATERMRPSFRAEATAQRLLLAEVDDLAERVVREREAILRMSEETRAPEETLRAAQLEGVLAHLDGAIDRMGQTRRQLRQRRAERAYRRSAAALGELKRARDQLRDPVEQIGVLLGEVAQLGEATGALLARDRPLATSNEPADLPAFLTATTLSEEVLRVAQRTNELGARLGFAAEQAGEQAAAPPPPTPSAPGGPDPAAQQALARALVEAAPRVASAGQALDRAATAAGGADWPEALEAEGEAARELAEAQEAFFDFDQRLAAMLADQTRIATGAALDSAARDAGDAPALDRDDLAPLLATLQAKNVGRAGRLAEQLAERRDEALAQAEAARAQAAGTATAPNPGDADEHDPVARERARFEMAEQRLALAEGAMRETLDGFGLDGADPAGAEAVDPDVSAIDWPAVAAASERARSQLEALQSLFFTLVEHLRALARDQRDLNDETAEAIALAPTERVDAEDGAETEGADAAVRGPDTRARARALAASQAGHETRGGAIADALLAQAEAMPPADAPPPPQGAPAGPDADTMRRAAEHVASAQLAMRDATTVLEDEAQAVAGAAAPQGLALESLLAALELLSPPPPPQEDPEASDQQEPEQGAEPEQPEDDGSEAAPERGAGEAQPPEEAAEQPEASEDPGQLLQGVRDREAQRRRDRERERAQRRSRPVEKDW